MFSGSTLGALTSAQEGASNLRQEIDSYVANQIVGQLGTDGEISLSQVENALGGSSGTTGSASGTAGSGSSSSPTDATSGLAAAFASLDANGDGELSTSELTNALNQMTGPGQTPGHHGHHHHHVDNDDDDGDANALASNSGASTTTSGTSTTGSGNSTTGAGGSAVTGAADPSSITGTTDSGSTTSGSTTAGSTTTGATTSDPSSTTPSVASTTSSTSTNTVSTLDGLTNADVAQALQAFLNSLAQSQAANLSALAAQSANPTNVTA